MEPSGDSTIDRLGRAVFQLRTNFKAQKGRLIIGNRRFGEDGNEDGLSISSKGAGAVFLEIIEDDVTVNP